MASVVSNPGFLDPRVIWDHTKPTRDNSNSLIFGAEVV